MKVTIGIPCYNAERWLRRAIESALAQTWPDLEVIVVDDGSADRSVGIAEAFGSRIHLLREARGGGNHARNQVLAHAGGEWIQFLDADDELEPEKIARQFAETNEGANADVIFSPVLVETTTAAGTIRRPTEIDPALDRYSQWFAWQLPQTGGGLWRKSALTSIGGWKEGQPCCQEHELYLRALQAGLRFVFAPTPHAIYRIWSDDTVCRRDPQQLVEVKTALLDELCTWLKARKLWTTEHRRIAGRACFEMARTLAKYDLTGAAKYHRERAARGLIELAGPAAPVTYRFAYHAIGFARAEKLAAARR